MSNSAHHVGILVDDIEQAVASCRLLLGLEAVPGIDSARMTTRFAPAGPISLEFIELHEPEERARRLGSETARIEHVALAVDDLERSTAHMRSQGARMTQERPQPSAAWSSYWTVPSTTDGVMYQILQITSAASGATARGPVLARARDRQVTERAGGVRTQVLLGGSKEGLSVTSGTTEVPAGGAVALHTHNCDESVLVVEGRGVLECGGEKHSLDQGDAVFVPQGQVHRFLNPGRAPLRIFWTYRTGEATRTLTDSGQTYAIGTAETT